MSLTKKILILILFFSLAIRLYGLNWDHGQHLHPDERFLTMVVSTIKLPHGLLDYLNPQISPLNPYNYHDYQFYVYGTFPLLITRIFAEIAHLTSYDQIFLVGRCLAALFDTFTIILIFLLALKLFKIQKVAILSAFLYGFCLFPIQQAHFFTVDSFAVFFSTLTLYLLLQKKYWIAGLIFGLTLASKISVAITLPIILLFIFTSTGPKEKIFRAILNPLVFLILTFFAFRLFQPYAFSGPLQLSTHFISNITQAHEEITGEIDYPPIVQWASTLPVIHPLINLFFAGLGPITFALFIFGLVRITLTFSHHRRLDIIFLLLFLLTIFLYHSFLLARYMRYFYPLYPIIVLFSGYGLYHLRRPFFQLCIVANLLLAFAFLHIYTLPHSRYVASEWICQEIPEKSMLSSELWDDSLPMSTPSCIGKFYPHLELALYDPDTPEKWTKLEKQFGDIQYLVLTSNRLWGSIPKVPLRYPQSSVFYKNLFEGKLNFTLNKRIYSYPGFSLPFLKSCLLLGPSVYPNSANNHFWEIDPLCHNPGIYLRDDILEESFTVYDHPQVLIFAKNSR